MIFFEPKRFLVFLFVSLGPLGNLLTPHFLPPSFRTYYFILPLFPIFFLSIHKKMAKIASLFLPFFLFCFLSSQWVAHFGSANEKHTLFRFYLFLCQFLFVVGAASSLKSQEELFSLLKTYIRFYLLSCLIGYVLFLGYYLKMFSFATVDRFSVLAQIGFGLLRFSPGSYPNEYGIVSSFVLATLLLLYQEKRLDLVAKTKKRWLFLLFIVCLALLLTTTRAAYLSCFISLLYILFVSPNKRKMLFRISCFIAALFSFLAYFNIHMLQILKAGFSQKLTEGSLGERYQMWHSAIDRFQNHELFGTGFASLTNAHNVYLQLFFELGLIGSAFFLITLILAAIESFFSYKRPTENPEPPLLKKVRVIGLINVLSFAASNHNLNHHLTWLTFFFVLVSLRQLQRGVDSKAPIH